GRYQARSGHDSNTTRAGTELLLSEVTIAQRFREQGYKTALVGKWHVGDTQEAYLPHSRGFDLATGSLGNIVANPERITTPQYFRGRDTFKTIPGAPITSPVYAEEACAFIEQHRE
ncbi:MAG: sulfatase-like hydrolase/transferase, partial [Pirellulaceae bacterium]